MALNSPNLSLVSPNRCWKLAATLPPSRHRMLLKKRNADDHQALIAVV
jgi:hypothetical protein